MFTLFTLITLYTTFCVSRKLGMKGWELFVPFFNLYKVTKVALGNGWLCFIFVAAIIPFVGWIVALVFAIIVFAKYAGKVAKAYGEYNCKPGWVFFIGTFYLPFYAFKDAPMQDDPLNKFVTKFFTLDRTELHIN